MKQKKDLPVIAFRPGHYFSERADGVGVIKVDLDNDQGGLFNIIMSYRVYVDQFDVIIVFYQINIGFVPKYHYPE